MNVAHVDHLRACFRDHSSLRERRGNSKPIIVAREKSPHPNPLPARPGRGDKTVTTRERYSRSKPIIVAHENPLTLTLSPQGRGEGTRRSQRASDIPVRNPSLSRVHYFPRVFLNSARMSAQLFSSAALLYLTGMLNFFPVSSASGTVKL